MNNTLIKLSNNKIVQLFMGGKNWPNLNLIIISIPWCLMP